ncbi:DUF7344 domain-containing protein [Halorussus sp. AFM4]|uniref:DUF7344 domain-containing protein n=1 Tax=Halorussus sp. AFM4 TaxID=3421651 RepID=UPI003EBC857F
MPKQYRSPTDGAPRRDRSRRSRPDEPVALRDARCRFVVDFLRWTNQRSPVHVTELVDEFLVGEMDDLPREERPAVRRDVYHSFSRHCLPELEAAGLVFYDRLPDTVSLR